MVYDVEDASDNQGNSEHDVIDLQHLASDNDDYNDDPFYYDQGEVNSDEDGAQAPYSKKGGQRQSRQSYSSHGTIDEEALFGFSVCVDCVGKTHQCSLAAK